MSYDVALFFRHPVFPASPWRGVLAYFETAELGVHSGPGSESVLAQWCVTDADALVQLELRDVRPDRYRKPPGTHWQVFIARVGHLPRAAWLQLALCHHALTLLDDVVFYDLQLDVSIADRAVFAAFASERLRQHGATLMQKLGLLDPEGRVLF